MIKLAPRFPCLSLNQQLMVISVLCQVLIIFLLVEGGRFTTSKLPLKNFKYTIFPEFQNLAFLYKMLINYSHAKLKNIQKNHRSMILFVCSTIINLTIVTEVSLKILGIPKSPIFNVF